MPETVCCTMGTPHLTWAEKEHKGGNSVHKGARGGPAAASGTVFWAAAAFRRGRPAEIRPGPGWPLRVVYENRGALGFSCFRCHCGAASGRGLAAPDANSPMRRRPGLDKAESSNPNLKAAHAGGHKETPAPATVSLRCADAEGGCLRVPTRTPNFQDFFLKSFPDLKI